MKRRHTGPPPDLPKLCLQAPTDVLASVPYVLGFHPNNSIVVLGIRAQRLTFSLRLDLPSADRQRSVQSTVDHLVSVLRQQHTSGVMLVGYGPDERVRPVIQQVRTRCRGLGLPVLDALRADGGRYWSYLCTAASCCPPDGSPYDTTTSTAAAAWTVAGVVALPDRQAYEDQLQPVGGAARESMRWATARAHERLVDLLRDSTDEVDARNRLVRAGAAARQAALAAVRAGEDVSDDDIGWLSVLLMSGDVLVGAWTAIKGEPNEIAPHRALWMDVLRRAELDLVPAPGSLFAYAAWRCGEGTLATFAIQRVLAVDSRYPLARQMEEVLISGLPPTAARDPSSRWVKRRSARRARRRSSSRRAESRPA